MSAPQVSILMPVRDAASTLAACLQSIAGQSMAQFELLVVDDHSSDDSRRLIRQAARHDPRIRLVDNPGRGIVAALNFGLHAAQAGLIARMDADDVMHPDRLGRQLQVLCEEPDVDVVGCQVEQFPALTDGAREYLAWLNQCCSAEQIDADIYVEAPFAHPSVMYRRKPIAAVGGYRQGNFPEDYDLWLRLHARGVRMRKLPEVLLYWRDSPGRLSRRDPRYRREAFDQLRARFLATDQRLVGRADNFVIAGAGRRTRQRCAHLLQRGFAPRAWIDIDPRKIGNIIDGVPVRAPPWLARHRCLVLGYVAVHGARTRLAAQLEGYGYRRGTDFLMVG